MNDGKLSTARSGASGPLSWQCRNSTACSV